MRAGLAALDRARAPEEWARGQFTQGNAYFVRIEGERAANLEAAPAAYQQALTVYTHAAFLVDWAMTTYNLALLYADLGSAARRRGDLEGCRRYREEAVNTMRATLDVYTADGFPDDHADAVRQVARLEAMSCEDDTPGTGDGEV